MSQTVVVLPRLIELRSQYNNKLLQYVKEEGVAKGFVQFSCEHVGDAEAKFEVHVSKTGNGLVHIRSCYNNKYLVLDKFSYIAAKAEKPEEDQSKRSCTLLRPTSVDGNLKKIRLTHVYREYYLRFSSSITNEGEYVACLKASSSDPDRKSRDVFDVIDWQSLVILPKYVAFKGDNNKFLRALWHQKHNYLQYSVTKMEDDPLLVGNEIVQTSNGNICIRSLYWDKYWKLSPNWIWADSTNSKSDDAQFEPIKYSDDTIALRNVANKKFCTRLTTERKVDCLNANSTLINTGGKIVVSELVISRKIENINFRLMDARIYGEAITSLDSSSHSNDTNTSQEMSFEFSYTIKTTSTWNSSVSLKVSSQAEYRARIPFIGEGKVTLGSEFTGEYSWGKTTEVEEKKAATFRFSVPPMTKVTARIMGTRGTCDVPFSYSQRDVLYTGETVTTHMDDGVYTGINSYSIYTEAKEESLLMKEDPNIEATGFKKVAILSPSGEMTPISNDLESRWQHI